MLLADTIIAPSSTIVTLDGVTTVLTGFIFVCLVMPGRVRQRAQFYAALACVAGIIVVHTLVMMFGLVVFGGIAIGVLQLFALLLLVLSVGGLSAGELGGEMARAYEVMRRGETEKEVIIPIGEAEPPAPLRRGKGQEASRKVYKIDSDEEREEDEGNRGIPLA